MKTIKDLMTEDVDSVFLNPDELADYHNIEGQRILCIVDRNLTTPADAVFEGVFINAVTIYVNKNTMRKPKEGARLRLDGSLFIVRSVSEEGGMFVITAESNEK